MSTLIYLVHQINFLQGLKRPHITDPHLSRIRNWSYVDMSISGV